MTTPHSEPWLDELHRTTTERLSLIAQVQDDLAAAYGEAHASHGRVHVRVNAAGRPTSLTIDPTARSLPAPDLAAAVLTAIDEAASDAAARVATIVGPLVPAGELDAMLSGVPSAADRLAVRDELDGPLPGG